MRLEPEHEHLRSALEWALEGDQTAGGNEPALRLAGAVRWLWRVRGHFFEGRTWLMRSLRQDPHRCTAARAHALVGESVFAYALGDLNAARLAAEESAAIYLELGDEQGLAEALS